ncbi:taste receptor cell protein 1-like [Sagmatias obliquidens]|uniref:taste receptor cell protein 1-like n=1 Tax=Sagmatias obliquidens TaxID=3371155 RepID=UPI000F43FD53|nr:taste receptor cell protein 1-like [Lagenorhynchus obliquidens]
MNGQWLPAAGLLLAAVPVVSASALPRLPPHKDLGPSPLASGTSALQGDSKKIVLPSLNALVTVLTGVFPAAKRPGEAPGRKGGALFPEAPGDQQALLGSLLDLPLHSDQPAPLGTTVVSGRATPRPAPSAVAEPAAHRAPESQPVSYVAGPGEEILVTGSPEIAAMSPAPSGASNFSPGAAPLLTLAPKAPEKAVSSAPQGPLAFTSISNTLAATEPLLPVATVWSGLDTASTALTAGSGSPRSGLASSLGPAPSGPSVLPLPSAVPSSQSSSASLPLSSPPSSLSPALTSPSPVLAPVSPFTTGARTSPEMLLHLSSHLQPQALSSVFPASHLPCHLWWLQGWLLFSGQSSLGRWSLPTQPP